MRRSRIRLPTWSSIATVDRPLFALAILFTCVSASTSGSSPDPYPPNDGKGRLIPTIRSNGQDRESEPTGAAFVTCGWRIPMACLFSAALIGSMPTIAMGQYWKFRQHAFEKGRLVGFQSASSRLCDRFHFPQSDRPRRADTARPPRLPARTITARRDVSIGCRCGEAIGNFRAYRRGRNPT